MKTKQYYAERYQRRDLSDAAFEELNAIIARGEEGRCTQEDMVRWRTLAPFRANRVIHNYSEVTTWYVECHAVPFSAIGDTAIPAPDRDTAMLIASRLSFAACMLLRSVER